MIRVIKQRAIIASFLFLIPVPSLAVSTLSIAPAGENSFVLSGNGLQDTAVIDVQVLYDQAGLANPRVNQGSLAAGAMTAANVNNPGVIRLSVIGNSAITGSGPIATILFDRTGQASAKIISLGGAVIDKTGKQAPLAFTVENPPYSLSSATTSAAAEVTTASSPATAAATTPPVTDHSSTDVRPFVAGGTLRFSTDETGKPERTPEVKQDVAEREQVVSPAAPELPSPPPQADPVEEKREKDVPVPVPAVVDRFKSFAGERTPSALIALFEPPGDGGAAQEPPVVIADGSRTAKLTLSRVPIDKSPNFVFTSARAVSVTVVDGAWIVEARPEKGAARAEITVVAGGLSQSIPITVSPAVDADLDGSGEVNEADMRLFLKEARGAVPARFDLNGDGKHDYLDDYVFTANYIVSGKQQKEPAEKKPEKMQ